MQTYNTNNIKLQHDLPVFVCLSTYLLRVCHQFRQNLQYSLETLERIDEKEFFVPHNGFYSSSQYLQHLLAVINNYN